MQGATCYGACLLFRNLFNWWSQILTDIQFDQEKLFQFITGKGMAKRKSVNLLSIMLILFWPEGACLVHSLNGDLLRSLDPPKGCLSPELIIVSREGFVLVKFDQGHICNFSINGRLLQNVNHRDAVHVRNLLHIVSWLAKTQAFWILHKN
mgnify:CR=1 FL=1